MKKLATSLFIWCMLFSVAFAQERTITGTVTSSEDGLPIPGASVKIKEVSNSGVATGADGKFSIKVPESGKTLIVSSIAYQTKEVAITGTSINVALLQDSKVLTEVVVTAALGERRESRSIGYAATEIKGDRLTLAKNTDVSTALAGKVAGVQLNGSPSSSFDNASVVVRGINGFSVGDPLYIIDGTPSSKENVNMDNIESLTVLKGAAATALYGQRAYNGVVLITSKKGTRKDGYAIEFNTGLALEKTSLLPDYQNEYAGGYTGQFVKFQYDPTIHPAEWAAFNGQNMLDYGADASFGPKIDGSLYRPYYSWYPGSEFGKLVPLTAQPNNIKDYLRNGGSYNNTVSFSSGGENYNLKAGYTNQTRTLVQDNASRSMNIFNLNGSVNIGKRVTLSTDVQYARESRIGQPYETYRNDGLNVVQGFNQWFQRQLDMNYMRDNQLLPNGTPTSWNIGNPNGTGDLDEIAQPQYWDNPFWVVNNNYRTQRNNRFVGNLGLKYDLGEGLAISGFARANINNEVGDERMATGGLQQDYFKTRNWTDSEYNYELNLTYNKTFGDFSLNALAAGNIRHENRERIDMSTEGGLSFPNYFNILASISRPTVSNTLYQKEVRSVFGKASLAYKNFLYLDVTARNDWSSVFAPDLNSYFYPSVSSSFVFSEFLGDGIKNVLSFGKLRAAYAQVGSDVDPYRISLQYNTAPGYGSSPSLALGNEFRNGRIVPAKTNSYEVGTELKFLKNRINFDFAYFVNKNVNQILSVTLNGATGYTSNLINAGDLTNRGFEFSLGGTPVQSKDVSWDITLNFSKSRTIVNKITEQQSNVIYETSTFFNNTLNLREGQEWGYVLGRTWNRDASGNVIIGPDGLPTSTANQFIGFARPRFNGGAYSSLRVLDFDLGFSLDFQKGGLFNSTTRAFTMGSGLSQETVGVNDRGVDWRLPVSQGGGYKFAGVLANGQPNNTYVSASTAFYNGMQTGSGEQFMIDASYLKLREVRLGYNLPTKVLDRTKFLKSANIGLVVGNAWLISAPGKKYGVDPSELENFWQEGGQLPSSRTWGLNIRVGL